MKKTLLAAAAVVALGTVAHAAGFWTNGLTASLGPRGNELIPADQVAPGSTNGASGTPLSVALTPIQIAGLAVPFATNTGSTVANAVTLNKGNIGLTTESLSTAVGSTYTFTWTSSVILATSQVLCSDVGQVSDVTKARFVVQSVTPAAGSVAVVLYNNGTAAASGTWAMGCAVYNN